MNGEETRKWNKGTDLNMPERAEKIQGKLLESIGVTQSRLNHEAFPNLKHYTVSFGYCTGQKHFSTGKVSLKMSATNQIFVLCTL
jgi:hypothetical protein